jgi:hypothetical protein
MRTAPPVSLRAGGGALWSALRLGLPALAAGSVGLWWLEQVQAPGWLAWSSPLLAALSAALLAGWRGREQPVELAWDGQRWSADGRTGRLDVMIDLQDWLLLRLRSEAPAATRWIALSARDCGAAWPALRVALYARPAGANRAGTDPAATGLPPAAG